jgi:hypothetical protein
MPSELLTALPQLAALIERLGVIGVLLIAVGWLVYERLRLMKEVVKVYSQRDRWRLACVKYKAACDTHNIHVDTTDLADLIEATAP